MPHDVTVPERLDTRRLIGRRPQDLDVPFLRLILQDEAAMRWLAPDGRPVTDARVAWLLDRLAAHWRAHDFGPRFFFLRAEIERLRPGHEPRTAFAGWCGLRHQLVEGRPEVELLYALRPSLWRQGYGSEMAVATVDEGFTALGVASVVAFTLPDNLGSRGVMARCGLAYERDITHAGLPHVLYRGVNPTVAPG